MWVIVEIEGIYSFLLRTGSKPLSNGVYLCGIWRTYPLGVTLLRTISLRY